MFNVYLDDIRIPEMSHNSKKGIDGLNWIIIRDYNTFVNFINDNYDNISIISFDHDLADYQNGVERTGKDAFDYLINIALDNDKELPFFYVHSDNTIGKENIIKTFISYIKTTKYLNINYTRSINGFYNNKLI